MLSRRQFAHALAATVAGTSPALGASAEEKCPTKPTSKGKSITVSFATNRETSPDKCVMFGNEMRGPTDGLFVSGTIAVVNEGGHPHAVWQALPSSLQINPSQQPSPTALAPLTKGQAIDAGAIDDFIRDLSKEPDEKMEASGFGIVFLHGFNSTFAGAMSAAAQIADEYGASKVFCFAWPSQGTFGWDPYLEDRTNVYASGEAIAAALGYLFSKLQALDAKSRPNLKIVCHSMGARALSAALQAIGQGNKESSALLDINYFSHALLFAPDEDNNALEEPHKLQKLLTLANDINVYSNTDDVAMWLSRFVNHVDALGLDGPTDFSKLPAKVISINCTPVGATYENNGISDFGHQYFRYSPPVAADARQVLLGVPPTKIHSREADPAFPSRRFGIPSTANASSIKAYLYKS